MAAAQRINLTGDYAIDQGADWSVQFDLKTCDFVVQFAGQPTPGTWVFGFGSKSPSGTTALDPAISAADLTTAIEALGSVGPGGVEATGPDGGPFLITFSAEVQAATKNASPSVSGSLPAGSSVFVFPASWDLTGFGGRMQLRSPDAHDIYVTIDDGAGLTIDPAGIVIASQTAAQTAAFTWRVAEYDLFMEDTVNAVIYPICYGKVENRLAWTNPAH